MALRIEERHFDVAVIGGGSAGVVAAIAAQRNGARTVLIEAGPMLGGELLSGLCIDGVANSRGEWIVGGIARELFDGVVAAGGYCERHFDWRTMWAVCLDPEFMKLVVVDKVAQAGVAPLLYTFADDVVTDGRRVRGVFVVNKNGRTLITADVFVDCSGDGDLAALAGAEWEKGGEEGQLQPISLLYRMSGVNIGEWLQFVRDHPDDMLVAENPVIGKTREECVQAIHDSGIPFAHLNSGGPLLSTAIDSGEMFPCAAMFMWPSSMPKAEVAFNATRTANVDATDTRALSSALATLSGQVQMGLAFSRERMPGFQQAQLSGVASRIGIRETRRIVGDEVLSAADVLAGKKRPDGIAKGGHHVDIHGGGTYQKRIPITDGMSYDIPYACLVPARLDNVLLAGRCISSDREANGSARVMGQCMATGQAAGTAAAMCSARGWRDVRDVPIDELRSLLRAQGAVLDGTA